MRPVMPANLLGLPAAAVPAGKAAGLPVGVQVMGGRFQELACLEAAEAIESRARRRAGDRPRPGGCRRQLSEHMFVLRWRGKPRRSDNANDHDRRSGRGRNRLGHPDRRAGRRQSSVQVPLAGHLTVASQMRAEHTELAQQRLTRKASRLADRVADARDRGFSPRAYRAPGRRRAARTPRPPRARAAPRAQARAPTRARRAAQRVRPPPRSRRSPPANPAATRARTPATGSTASTSSRCRRGRASAAAATRRPPARPSRTAAPRCSTPARAPRPGPSAVARVRNHGPP